MEVAIAHFAVVCIKLIIFVLFVVVFISRTIKNNIFKNDLTRNSIN